MCSSTVVRGYFDSGNYRARSPRNECEKFWSWRHHKFDYWCPFYVSQHKISHWIARHVISNDWKKTKRSWYQYGNETLQFAGFNPLSVNIQIQILHLLISIHLLKVSWENLTKKHRILSWLIILIVLIIFPLDYVLTVLGENWCWSLRPGCSLQYKTKYNLVACFLEASCALLWIDPQLVESVIERIVYGNEVCLVSKIVWLVFGLKSGLIKFCFKIVYKSISCFRH